MAVKTNCIKNGVPYYRIHRKINGKYEDCMCQVNVGNFFIFYF